jgi:hypothetical protein
MQFKYHPESAQIIISSKETQEVLQAVMHGLNHRNKQSLSKISIT